MSLLRHSLKEDIEPSVLYDLNRTFVCGHLMSDLAQPYKIVRTPVELLTALQVHENCVTPPTFRQHEREMKGLSVLLDRTTGARDDE
jgi:hypothetical protein